MEMPDVIYAALWQQREKNDDMYGTWDDDPAFKHPDRNTYHHDRILKAKDAEIAELKAYIESRGYDAP
jgi:hypothetical protein